GAEVKSAKAGEEILLITNQTPFYGLSGGQAGDIGIMESADVDSRFIVEDTLKKLGDLHVHVGRVDAGEIRIGDVLEMEVATDHRACLRANHSATHLLHAALRHRLGAHVTQKGSLVAPDRLRFDFSHSEPLTPEERLAVEADVNRKTRQNSEVTTRLMTPDEAVGEGALALFGEKYADEVRVLSMGEEAGKSFSVELCGGTHVRRTGDIGFFKITGESAVASGVRRIEALTGEMAEDFVRMEETHLHEAAALLKVAPGGDALVTRIGSLMDERKRLERELQQARRDLARGGAMAGGGVEKEGGVRDIEGCKYLARLLKGVPAKELRPMADDLKKQVGSGVVAIVGVGEEGKVSLVVGVTDDLTDGLNAVDLVKAGAGAMGGKGGGGRPDMAQGGGVDPAKGEAALEAIAKAIAQGIAKSAGNA
ncbi:MAG: alanine--tRNA ligase, partial [Rhodospirillaceae bacterium]